MASEILIRFNTKHNGSPLVWRVFVDGKESLASSVSLFGKFSDKRSFENGVEKLNIFCLGSVSWNQTEATITSGETNG